MVAALLGLVDSLDVWLAGRVGKSHDPAIDVLVQLSNVLGYQALVSELALGVPLEFLASELSGGYVPKVHEWVLIDEIDQGLAGIATGADQSNTRRSVIGGILLPEGRVRVGGGVLSQRPRR